MFSGARVSSGGREVDSPVNAVDLFATILELAGVDVASTVPEGVEIDSVSLVPYLADANAPAQRDWIYTELFGSIQANVDGDAIRDERYKFIRFVHGPTELYDLESDPEESNNLLDGQLSPEQESHYLALLEARAELLLDD